MHGWGMTQAITAELLAANAADDLPAILAEAKHGAIARGLGRSYGDPAQLAGGLAISLLGAGRQIDLDPTTGLVTVGGGVSLDALISAALPLGWFVPVTPGTRQVTVGGAIAFDVHGKNHHADGSFANHVRSITLATPTGIHELSPESQPELFWATAGGMGLTGIITSALVQMIPVNSSVIAVDTDRYPNLDAVMAAMVEGDDRYRYSVAWVDCMRSGASMGRAILTRGEHVDDAAAAVKIPKSSRISVPFKPPSGLLNRLSITAFNEAWFRVAPSHAEGEIHELGAFFHPLDGLAHWNRLYGPRGFVQWQCAVPDQAGEVIATAIKRLSERKVPSFLGVLKRFGPGNAGLLSFPMAGWTLALDLPVGPSALPEVLDELDELVVAAGGRIYLAKDSRLSPRHLRAMHPRLDEFLKIKASVDPRGVLRSDLSVRLGITSAMP